MIRPSLLSYLLENDVPSHTNADNHEKLLIDIFTDNTPQRYDLMSYGAEWSEEDGCWIFAE